MEEKSHHHSGYDLHPVGNNRVGAPVVSTTNGTIVAVIPDKGSLGDTVIVRDYNNNLHYYGHLDSFASGTKVGSPVGVGNILGGMGMTGNATGPHLHYEIRQADNETDIQGGRIVDGLPFFEGLYTPFTEDTISYHGEGVVGEQAAIPITEVGQGYWGGFDPMFQ